MSVPDPQIWREAARVMCDYLAVELRSEGRESRCHLPCQGIGHDRSQSASGRLTFAHYGATLLPDVADIVHTFAVSRGRPGEGTMLGTSVLPVDTLAMSNLHYGGQSVALAEGASVRTLVCID